MALRPTSGMGYFRMTQAGVLLVAPGRRKGFDPETVKWIDVATQNGGTFLSNSQNIADALIVALHGKSYNSKITYLLPLLGGNLATARVPLRDTLNVGIAGNTGFVDADFSEATGLQGNGTSKALNLIITPQSLTGGIGYWENNIAFTGTDSTAMGTGYTSPADTRFFIDLRPALRVFSWGDYANRLFPSLAGVNGHYYGQRFGSALSYSLDGVLFDSGTATDSVSLVTGPIKLMGWSFGGTDYFWAGRCACAYMTTGTMNASEIADFDALLDRLLITPTGRPS